MRQLYQCPLALTPSQGLVFIIALLLVGGALLALILLRIRAVNRRIDAARGQADAADALAKAVGMLDSVRPSDRSGETDDTTQ